ncbi:MAG: hypothetical protein JO311_03550 [Candidatus Eremiobacteraeota bacterium]|nr:hypothetical protein [Candidatus Eremiobacteraeota bacterium]
MKTLALTAVSLVALLPAGVSAAGGLERPTAVAWVHHPVSPVAAAQAAFDRGLLDYYAYNPEAAEHNFYAAADLDRHCAMAYWGIAVSNAPNLNVDATDDRSQQAREAIEQAKSFEKYASTEDRAFIDAAAARFDDQTKAAAPALLAKYRDALLRVATAYPNDPDAAALYAESALYVAVGDQSNDTPSERGGRKARISALLPFFAAGLARFPNHVGLLHFYIHAAQGAAKSALAIDAATRLASYAFPPQDSHLTHMPGHIFFDVGMYAPAVDVGRRSVAMDFTDFACCHPGYYSGPRYYHSHNVSFLLYALTETGRLSEALAAARREDDPYLLAIQLVAAQDWRGVLAVPYTKGKLRTLPFARGLAFAKLGNAAMAAQARGEIASADSSSTYDVAVVAAMRATLSGEIAALRHDDAKALQSLTDASAEAAKADAIGAEFPDLYYYSPHMALAALALRLGKAGVAKAALQAELNASPRSPLALKALTELAAH